MTLNQLSGYKTCGGLREAENSGRIFLKSWKLEVTELAKQIG